MGSKRRLLLPLRRPARLVSVAILLTVALVSVPARPVGACICEGSLDDAEAARHADVVFTGTLLQIRPPGASEVSSTGDPERWIFEVSEVHKGEAFAVQSVVTAVDSMSCGLVEAGGDGPYVVFATTDPGISPGGIPGEVHANRCGGTRSAAGSPFQPGDDGLLTGSAAPRPGSSPVGTWPPGTDSGSGSRFWLMAAAGGATGLAVVGAVILRRRRRVEA